MEASTGHEVIKKISKRITKAVFTYDVKAGTFSFLNGAFSLISGIPREKAKADPSLLLETVHLDDREYATAEYRELSQGEAKEDVEFRLVRPDGAVAWVQVTAQLLEDGTVAGMAEDVTLAKENIAVLEKFAAKKNSVLEILSHDLAGPLANIEHLAEILSEETQAYGNAEVDDLVRMIRNTSARNVRMIREFVRQEFLESSEVALLRVRVDLVEKVREMVEQYRDGEIHIRKDIGFTCSADKIFVMLDQNKFLQALNNLFSNAIKFTPDEGTISIDLTEREESVLITVADNGIGIPEKYHRELFDKFTNARREGLRGEPSTGLGMSIIKTIVEWHKGKIWFASEENVGTTFYIEIPKE